MSISSNSIPNLFKGVNYYIHDSLHPKVHQALSQLLNDHGATQSPPPSPPSSSPDPATPKLRFDPTLITHLITDTLYFPEHSLLQQINDQEVNNDNVNDKGKGKGVIANVKGASVNDEKIKIVLPAWVTRSFDLQAIQQARFYSPDPALFLSTTCICTSQLPIHDDLTICSAVETFGGQWRRELTREVTHLICVSEQGEKYEMAIKFGTELGIAIVLPHWFEECLKTNRLSETDIYRFPSPPCTTTLRTTSTSSNKPFVERLNEYWKQRLTNPTSSSSSSSNSGPPRTTPNTCTYKILGLEVGVSKGLGEIMREKEGYFKTSGLVNQIDSGVTNSQLGLSNASNSNLDTQQQHLNDQIASLGVSGVGGGGKKRTIKGGTCFKGKKVYLASDLGLSRGILDTLESRIEDLGGEVCENHLSGDGETVEGSLSTGGGDSWNRRRKAERELRESQIVIMRNREGWEYWLAYELNLSICTLPWLFHAFLTSTCTSPLSKLTHYPPPSIYGIPAFRDKTITVSNYTGSARDYVRMLIEMLGAKYEGTMGKGTDYVVTASDLGSKCSHARTWAIPLVTHEWLESCVLTWSHLSPALSPTYTISTGQQYGMSYPNSLGERGWTKEAIKRWADAEERKEERDKGRRSVEELIRLEEEEKRGEGMVMDEEGKSTEVEGDEDVEMETEEKQQNQVVKEVPVIEVRRQQSKEKPSSKTSLLEKGKEKEVAKPISKTKAKKPRTVEDQVMDVDRNEDESTPAAEPARPRSRSKPVSNPAKPASPPPFPARIDTPEQPKRKKTSTTKPTKLSKETSKVNQDENGSSALSEAEDDDDDEGSKSTSSSSSLPPSAKAMSKHFNRIDSHNLVQPGSKRAAAGKARAALHVAMEDKNKFDLEQKSSAKKTGLGPRRSSQGLGPKEGDSSPIKKRKVKREEGSEDEDDLAKDVNDENEEEKPVIKKSRGKAKAKREITEDVEVDEDVPKKKAKVAVNKTLKKVTTQDGTTQEGAISSFDNPPRAKPVPLKSNKLRIISTGLGLDKTSTEIKALKSLGVVWTDKPQEATHLVVKGLSRTEKFLCCLPFTPFIVTKKWIDACIAAGELVDEAPYLLKDKKKENELGDTLQAILSRAKKGKMLEGRKVYVTKGVIPEVAVMQRIIAACGGIIAPNDLIKQHKKIMSDPSALVVSSPNDRREWEKLSSEGIPIYTVEAVFVAAMHQQVEKGFTSANRVDPQLTA